MARTSVKSGPLSRRKADRKRNYKEISGNKIGVVIEGFSTGITDTLNSNVPYDQSVRVDEKESQHRKDANVGISDRVLEEKQTTLQKLEKQRGSIYGDPFLSHQAIGLAWEGVFRNRYHGISEVLDKACFDHLKHGPTPGVGKMFPADLVAEMLAAFKIVRLARPKYLQDSADDAKVYISFSERFRNENKSQPVEEGRNEKP